jgi:hypothetical protein
MWLCCHHKSAEYHRQIAYSARMASVGFVRDALTAGSRLPASRTWRAQAHDHRQNLARAGAKRQPHTELARAGEHDEGEHVICPSVG